jgi:hypothetical protein
MVFTFSSTVLTSSALNGISCPPLGSKTYRFTWTFLMAFANAKFKAMEIKQALVSVSEYSE